MEADGPANTKSRECTEGPATAVQAIHEDSCSAKRVDPNPMCSTSFGDDCTELPVLSCSREDALVDNGAAAPKSCLQPPWRGAQPQPRVAYFPPPNPLQQRRPPSTTQLFGPAKPKRRMLKGLSAPSTWYDDSSFRRNELLAAPS